MRKRGLRQIRHTRMRMWYRVLVVLAMLVATAVICLMRCRKVVFEFAKSNAAWTAEKTVNDITSRVLVQHSDVCRDLVSVVRNDQQIVSSVIIDSGGVNTLKTAVSVAVMDALEDATSVTADIPLGTLIGLDWMSGWGPTLSVPMSASQSVFTSISSSLTDVGINQSSYRVNIHVKANLWIVTPAGYASVTVENDFPVAEAVLLGDVPENLTEVYGDGQDTIGEIFDYGTIND